MNKGRPPAVSVAAVLLALFSVGNMVPPSLMMTPVEAAEIPAFVLYSTVVLGVVGLVAAYGLWTLKRWGVWPTIVLSVVNILLAAPGMFFAPTVTLRVLTIAGVVGFALVIVLVLLPVSRRAYA